MIRELLITTAITGAAVGMAPAAVADPGPWDGDVPGINYDASLGATCWASLTTRAMASSR